MAYPPQHYPPYPVYVAPPPTSGLAVASLILGIVSIGGGFCLLAIPPVLAVLFGHMARRDTKLGVRGGNGMAVAGLIMGYLTLIPAVIFAAQVIAGLATMDLDTTTP